MEITTGNHTTKLPDTTPIMTHAEWEAEGKRRFGPDCFNWKFKCPICGNVAAVSDFHQYKDIGATPNSAVEVCIGRYTRSKFKAFGSSTAERGAPCDYALFGLFRLPGVIVLMPDGEKRMAFAFAEVPA
jgi:hypothetical protein